jgi:hypothetical protein
MVMLWQQHADQWESIEIAKEAVALPAPAGIACPIAIIVEAEPDSPSRRALLVSPGANVLVNGTRVVGLRLLDDRDQLRIGESLFYFSAESLPKVEPYAGPQDVPCGRCLRPMDAGIPSVRCPRCGVFHHSSEQLACWTHASTCSGGCGQPTDPQSGQVWSPAAL